jgi:hypothetical protein
MASGVELSYSSKGDLVLPVGVTLKMSGSTFSCFFLDHIGSPIGREAVEEGGGLGLSVVI